MSSSNITHSDKHKNLVGHLGMKNETHNKTGIHGHMDTHKKQNSLDNTTVHGIKDSKKHVPANTYTKNTHPARDVPAHETTKHNEVTDAHGAHSHSKSVGHTNTHRKIPMLGHSYTRGISRKSEVHKQRMDKHEQIEHDKTDPEKKSHSEIDHAVSISISTASEDTSPENLDSTDQN